MVISASTPLPPANPGQSRLRLDSSAARNPGIPLDLGLVRDLRINRSAVERATGQLSGRRSVKGAHQAAWLLRAIGLMDLTTLSGDDTPANVRRLCAKARRPLTEELADALGVGSRPIQTAAICVYHSYVETAVRALEGSGIPVAAVSTAFPHGLAPLETRLAEIRASVAAGATEIDVVITRAHALGADWSRLYDEVAAFRDACGEAHLKTILATGELGTLQRVAQASMVCMMAGADFIKTSTGKETINATLPVGLVMLRTLRRYVELTGYPIGFKPAGGIRTAKDALAWMVLVREELGAPWVHPDFLRLGASSLLSDIERQLEHHVTGRYSAFHRHPMP
jgi:deoxyribose-phosphate aldolase